MVYNVDKLPEFLFKALSKTSMSADSVDFIDSPAASPRTLRFVNFPIFPKGTKIAVRLSAVFRAFQGSLL
ncbi:MAG: hypothetical protein EBR09_13030 [Proteobacteria bacterium]|nr:hypothetical protein [Pseudomonadota bacterium]